MLSLFFPLMLLLLFKSKWNQSIMFLSLMIIPSTLLMMSKQMPANMSELWGLDHLSASLIILTLWIMPMIMSASQNIYTQKKTPGDFLFLNTMLALILLFAFSTSHLFLFYMYLSPHWSPHC